MSGDWLAAASLCPPRCGISPSRDRSDELIGKMSGRSPTETRAARLLWTEAASSTRSVRGQLRRTAGRRPLPKYPPAKPRSSLVYGRPRAGRRRPISAGSIVAPTARLGCRERVRKTPQWNEGSGTRAACRSASSLRPEPFSCLWTTAPEPIGRSVDDERVSGQRKLRPTGAPEGCACYSLSVAPGVPDAPPSRAAGFGGAKLTGLGASSSAGRRRTSRVSRRGMPLIRREARTTPSIGRAIGDEQRLIEFGQAK